MSLYAEGGVGDPPLNSSNPSVLMRTTEQDEGETAAMVCLTDAAPAGESLRGMMGRYLIVEEARCVS
ncbi:hypothetical protein DNTS_013708 [Danionella cerebrum]|uniref:Uncharacterized protein n=1 Tax=Danionella cerebrum TaxID=2873325 RepID=A0A553P1B4_9TELE|nr:hypothetical protein DNTS_013708 [Danionella translucida]